jgi:hypothetical protein
MTNELFIGKVAMAKELGVTTRHSFVAGPWSQIDAQVDQGKTSGDIQVSDTEVPWLIKSGIKGGHTVVPMSAIAAFKAQFAERPIAGADYLNRGELAVELGIHSEHRVIDDAWKKMTKQTAQGKEAGSLEIEGRIVEWRIFYSARNLKLPFIARTSLEAFRVALEKIPEKATADQLSFSRLADELGVPYNHVLLAEFLDEVETQVNEGNKDGVIALSGHQIPWTMLQAKWGGSSRWGNTMPHVPSTSVPAFAAELAKRYGSSTGPRVSLVGVRPIDIKRALNTSIMEGSPMEYEVETEIEIGLIVTKSGRTQPVKVIAVPTANSNFMFEVFGVRHVLTTDGRVLQRVEADGRIGWAKSALLSVDPDYELTVAVDASTTNSMKP